MAATLHSATGVSGHDSSKSQSQNVPSEQQVPSLHVVVPVEFELSEQLAPVDVGVHEKGSQEHVPSVA
jgi:hypothetical protein